MSNIYKLLKLAQYMGLDETVALDGQVFYRKPGYEAAAVYDPSTNPKQSQVLQERIGISTEFKHGDWVGSIDNDEVFITVTADNLRDAILNVALQYIKFKRRD